MIVYVYGKCSTCKNAIHFLEKHKIAYTAKEITEETPSLAELQQMLHYQGDNLKKLLNTSGLLYKEMQLSTKLNDMPIDRVLSLLNQHGMLVKRPFLIGKNFGLTGFNETEWLKMFQSN